VLGKRKSFPASDGVSMKTLMRWKVTGAVNVDHLLGFSMDASPEEHNKAEELLTKTGLLICCLCGMSVSANKKSVKRHQVKNRNHLKAAADFAAGARDLDMEGAMAVANRTLSSESRLTAAEHNAATMKLPRTSHGSSLPGTPGSGYKMHGVPSQASLSEEAWEIINHDGKVVNRQQLNTLLQQLGVYEGKDLFYCDPKEIMELSKQLKKVPQRRFQQIFGLDTPQVAPSVSSGGSLLLDM
jgi:hypothetical protein